MPRSRNNKYSALSIEWLEDRRVLATLIVNSNTDAALISGAGVNDGLLTLREAVAVVNGTYLPPASTPAPNEDSDQIIGPIGANDKIVFDSSVFGPNGSASKIELLHGELTIENSVIIDGSGYNVMTDMADDSVGWENLTIDASTYTGNTSADSDGARIFNINMLGSSTAESVEITDLSLKGGDPDDHGGAIYAGLNSTGGADDLKLSRLYVYDNQSSKSGGGIYVNADQSG